MTDNHIIDLRSDTVTRPSKEMRQAMAGAEVGDDVLDGDPTTRKLEARVAEMLGCEAGLFFPTGTQANQAGINVLTSPGSEIICDERAHIVIFEKAGLATISGVQPHTVTTDCGRMTADLVAANINDSPYLSPITAVEMENTHNMAGGTVMSEDLMKEVSECAREHGLGVHLDGARIWNAAATGRVHLENIGLWADTVMVCFSKGLGCPVGSCLVGKRDLLEEAWHVRKRLGGGMRQSGVLAAACLYSLEHVLPFLGDDHESARIFADALSDHPNLSVGEPETNIVMLELKKHSSGQALDLLQQTGVLLVPVGKAELRAVTHRDVTADDLLRAANLVGEALN